MEACIEALKLNEQTGCPTQKLKRTRSYCWTCGLAVGRGAGKTVFGYRAASNYSTNQIMPCSAAQVILFSLTVDSYISCVSQ